MAGCSINYNIAQEPGPYEKMLGIHWHRLVLHNIENISQLPAKPSLPATSESPLKTLPVLPSPPEDPDPPSKKHSSREYKNRGKQGKKKRGGPNHSCDSINGQSLSSSTGDTPLSLSGVSNKSSGDWLMTTSTLSNESLELSKSQVHESSCCDQSVQKSPRCGHKRKHSNSSNLSPEMHAPMSKHPRYDSPHLQSSESVPQHIDCNSNMPVNDEQSLAVSLPFSPPVSSDELGQSNSKRKRNSTYTLAESTMLPCEEHEAAKHEDEQPPSKRVRRATFSVSPKVPNQCENDGNSINSISSDGEVNGAQVLGGIVDAHLEIMNFLDKKVEEIRKLYPVIYISHVQIPEFHLVCLGGKASPQTL